MLATATRSDELLDLVLFSLRDRKALCTLVLAAYRIELTTLLHRMANGGVDEEDAFLVYDLATRIAEAADAARIGCVWREALALQERAAQAHGGGERAEGAMLAAGLTVVERILQAAKTHNRQPSERAPTLMN